MSKIIIALLLTASLSFNIVSAEAPTNSEPYTLPPKTEWSKQEVVNLVNENADKYNISKSMLNFVVNCESGYNYKAVNWSDSHALSQGSHGVAQFSRETFLGFSKTMGKDYDDIYNPEQALDVMAWAISKGYGSHWTCYRKY